MTAKEHVATHVTRSEFFYRHQHCVTLAEVTASLRRTLRVNPQYVVKPENKLAVCDHPEDGVCWGAAGMDITDAQLAEVNERLAARSGKKPKPEKAVPAAAVSEPAPPTEGAGKPKRGLPPGLQKYLDEQRKRRAGK